MCTFFECHSSDPKFEGSERFRRVHAFLDMLSICSVQVHDL